MKINLTVISIFILLSVFLGSCDGSSPVIPVGNFSQLEIIHSEMLSPRPLNARDTQISINPVTNELAVVWVRTINDGAEVNWRHGQPGEFSPEEAITTPDGLRSWNPSITHSHDGRLHLAWMDQEIDGKQKETYARTWDGSSWSDGQLLTMADGWTSWDPDIETYPDGRPVVAWFDHRFGIQHEIVLRIGDGLGMWWPDVRITNDDHWQYFPDLEIDKMGTAHCSYVDARHEIDEWENPDHYAPGRNLEVYYRTWAGGDPTGEIRISNTPLRTIGSQMAVDGNGDAHIIFLDESLKGYWILYYVKVENSTPSEMVRISNINHRADIGAIGSHDNRVYIVWPEYPDPDSPVWSETIIYIREILPDGRLGTPLPVNNSTTGLHPSMELDQTGQNVWITWMNYYGSDPNLIKGETEIMLAGVSIGR